MEKTGVNELRKKFLEFFESKGHLAMKSFSLVPHNDKSLLLINAGMAPLKPYFTGQETPPRKRVCTCQKCVRTGDIENVGKTARHLTFFEMLGNFSFGDYFKEEALTWTWEFLTEWMGLDPQRLYPSIYEEDEEAYEIWTKKIGVSGDKITRFARDPKTGECDNFWEHGAGPCGPCSEVYYDRGEKYGCGKDSCGVGCDCDRYMEVWNDVFTQFESDGKGNYTELSQKNIDTGMGLERLAVVVQNVDSVFDIDTMVSLRDKICSLSDVKYNEDEKKDVSIRLITDHIRSSTFMISDGIMPSNEGRGYVLRRLIRRIARHGRLLGMPDTFISELSKTVIEDSKEGYPELEEKKTLIINVLDKEEEQFARTIDQGLVILKEMLDDLEKSGKKTLSGDDAFKLYDTYGFPVDLTVEICEEDGFDVDMDGFDKAMEKQKKTARAARKETNYMGQDSTVYENIDPAIVSEFVGYDRLEHSSEIIALTTTENVVADVSEGDEATIITKQTPFYGTMGGQEGDFGTISFEGNVFRVETTIHIPGGRIGHVGVVESGTFSVGDTVSLSVDSTNRKKTCKNHSATHLLQKALRVVLGDHVEQQGSFVDGNRLRFDFTHFKAMTEDEIKKTQDLVNREIGDALAVTTIETSLDEAKKMGAMALFGEKYKDVVRVVSMGDFSVELCGGTHVNNTNDIATFKILSENGVAAGVRRIEAITGEGVLEYYSDMEKRLDEACMLLKASPKDLGDKISHLLSEMKEIKSENEALKSKAAQDALGDVSDSIEEIGGFKFISQKLKGVDMNGLRDLGDKLKNQIGEGIVVLASENDGKVSLMAMATDAAVKAKAHAGNLIKEIAPLVGGGGGGRPNMAQAGGKNPGGIEDALKKAKEALEKQLS